MSEIELTQGKIKRCPKCNKTKELIEFNKDKQTPSGLQCYCRECNNEERKKYYQKNRDKVIARTKEYGVNHREKCNEYNKKWREKNPEKWSAMIKKYELEKLSTPNGRLQDRMSAGMRHSLKRNTKKGQHWETLVDYTTDQLKAHLEKQFQKGMSWENVGKWHIDHKIPITAFNYEKPEDIDFKKAWSLNNLQPLWAAENIRKSNKLKEPFQPSLAMGI